MAVSNQGWTISRAHKTRSSSASNTLIARGTNEMSRTGHCSLKELFRWIGVALSAQCLHGKVDQTAQHIIQAYTCSVLDLLHDQTWPEDSTLQKKLWGTNEDLK